MSIVWEIDDPLFSSSSPEKYPNESTLKVSYLDSPPWFHFLHSSFLTTESSHSKEKKKKFIFIPSLFFRTCVLFLFCLSCFLSFGQHNNNLIPVWSKLLFFFFVIQHLLFGFSFIDCECSSFRNGWEEWTNFYFLIRVGAHLARPFH